MHNAAGRDNVKLNYELLSDHNERNIENQQPKSCSEDHKIDLIENPHIEDTIGSHEDIDLNEDPSTILAKLRAKNPNRPIIGHININFLGSKFESLKELIKDKLDILVINETKIDESFPTAQFKIDGFSTPFRLDRNKHGGE